MVPTRCQRAFGEPRNGYMTMMCVVFTAIGLSLLLQPHRYGATSSYANLLALAPARVWAAAYLTVAALKAVYLLRYRARWLEIVTHTLSIMLVSAWLTAFVIRYITDTATTVVNVASWSVYLYLLLLSALADQRPPPPGPRP